DRVEDRVRVTEGEVELIALERGLEADALDLELLHVTHSDALDHAGDHRTGGAEHGSGEAALIERLHADLVVGDGDLDLVSEGLGHLALGYLDMDGLVLDLDLHLVGNGNGLFTDAAHGAVSLYQTLQRSSPPAFWRRQS